MTNKIFIKGIEFKEGSRPFIKVIGLKDGVAFRKSMYYQRVIADIITSQFTDDVFNISTDCSIAEVETINIMLLRNKATCYDIKEVSNGYEVGFSPIQIKNYELVAYESDDDKRLDFENKEDMMEFISKLIFKGLE